MTKHHSIEARSGAVTLQQIADRCGVSKCTVSLALHGHARISAATRERVAAVAREMGYSPAVHEMARRLALRKQGKEPVRRLIALFFSTNDHQCSFFGTLFRGVMEGLMEEGFGLLTLHTPTGQDGEDGPWEIFSRGDVDGVILTNATGHEPRLLQRLRENLGFQQRPVVRLIYPPLAGCGCVLADHTQGGYLAAQHLLSLGHRHLLSFIYPGTNLSQDSRTQGMRRAMTEACVNPDTHLHPYAMPLEPVWNSPKHAPLHLAAYDGPRADDEASRQFAAYLFAHPEITAVLALNDANAAFAWRALHQAGLRVPDDISIIGFDDTDPILNANGANVLTSVHVPLLDIGRHAAHLIVKQVTGHTPAEETITLPVALKLRASTSPARPRAVAR